MGENLMFQHDKFVYISERVLVSNKGLDLKGQEI